MVNSIGRRIPDVIPGYKKISPYSGPFAPAPEGKRAGPTLKSYPPSHKKILSSIEEAIEASGLKDGMTISFHHALRNGDRVMNTVMSIIAKMGFRNLRLAPSSFLDTNDDLIPYFEAGVITAAQTSGVRGRLGEYLTRTRLPDMTVIRTHGGRVRAITDGTLHIDIAFLAAPACDRLGNINGVEGPSACGSLGYAMIDARYADTVVAITDNLTDHVLCPISIPHHFVDYIVPVDSIGDPHGISSGSLRLTTNPRDLLLAKLAARIIEKSGYYREGFALQLGAGAASVAVGRFLRESMLRDRITADFAIGGIPGPFCDLLDEGLIRTIFDAQSFDLRAISSLRDNPRHQEYDIDQYANPWNKGAMVNFLDYAVLGATEVDTNFNVNVITDSKGQIMGALGGHPDASAGAKCTIIVTPLVRGRLPIVTDSVQTISTPGETVDVVVTERGIAINPKRADLREQLANTGLPIVGIEKLRDIAYDMTGVPDPIQTTDEVTAVIEYRDGSVLDVVRRPVD
jgi:citrate lyase subunit alpha/citrate CoA-transferase